MLPDPPSNESSTPGTDAPRASGPSNVGLARRVPITKAMRLEASKERFFRTPRLTPRSRMLGTHQRPLKWRLALSPQPGPSTDAADSKEEAPPWENIVVQLFREDEGQQAPEGQTPALPSTSPGPSTAQGRGAALQGGRGLAGCRSDGECGAGSAQGSGFVDCWHKAHLWNSQYIHSMQEIGS
ncbi:uncharacterized protein LOC118261010 isoform X3 [Cygnus atratus]|uniref:uncharacterized protein LOC118261010 isoform X3 n=1 Tax=Cygnus atratus TaxID=8868 RepID=UPI0015D6249F|nr:uncharacterized protein LOC118261010 isoform X3 [Cygnus atratus]